MGEARRFFSQSLDVEYEALWRFHSARYVATRAGPEASDHPWFLCRSRILRVPSEGRGVMRMPSVCAPASAMAGRIVEPVRARTRARAAS